MLCAWGPVVAGHRRQGHGIAEDPGCTALHRRAVNMRDQRSVPRMRGSGGKGADVGGDSGEGPDEVVLGTPHQGIRQGVDVTEEDGVTVFRGVPFARPPVGALRLAAPVPSEPWDGVREAGAFGPPPPQSRVLGASGAGGDWLTVNVRSPDLGAARLPVMVWIHGGGTP
jgi:hypothetical protein